ncbi:MAG: DUF1573 domain-containing protein [Bacteroidetes bacterium]|nr:DUF1573 domain-containing protein [Bacteroidota bacterium]
MKNSLLILTILVTLACGGKSSVAVDEGKKTVTGNASDDLSKTTMKFDNDEIDLGNVQKGSKTKAIFTVTNTGKNPLKITDVKPSCGCTTASKPENPILPGKSEKIEIYFEPNSEQVKEQIKSVTVIANTDPPVVVLKFKAYVLPN